MSKSFNFFSVSLILFLAALHTANAAPNDPVTIPDANLRAVIETALGKTSGATITEAEMDSTSLTGLSITSAVSNLEGLQYATSLTSITLRPNGYQNFNDLSPIRNLPLNRLFIRFNLWINNFSVLGDLPKTFDALTLQLTNLSESDLESFLPHLTGLGLLSIRQSDISDLSVLNNFTGKLYQLDVRSLGPQGNGLALKDLEPLVEFARTKVRDAPHRSAPRLEVSQNYRLNYASIYEHLPEILRIMDKIDMDTSDEGDQPASFQYDASTPELQRVSPETVTVRPGETHTHTVLGVNTTKGKENRQFEGVPVAWSVDGGTATRVPTRSDGLSSFTFTPRNRREYIVEAVVPAKETVLPATATKKIEHPELRVTFTSIVDSTAPPLGTDKPVRLTVTFEDYPEEKPIDEFTLTIKFSEPVIGFETEDITVETELTSGKGEATLTALTPETPIHPDRPAPDPIQTYTATVQLPDRARGTVRLIVRENAATAPFDLIGPEADTASDPIEFGRRRVIVVCPPSVVPMDRVIFNEFRNAEDDTHDWIELKNISNKAVSLADWEVSLVVPHAIGPATPQWEILAMDRDVVAFGDSTLPAGGILLIVNTHPSETDLIRGQNIENPNSNPDLFPKYLIAPEMRLPNTRYLLILRSVRDKNGQYEGFEDLAGDYHKDDVNYATNIWPLLCTPVYTGTAARFTVGDVYQRVMAPKFSANTFVSTLQPEKRGYLEGAWTLSESHGGLGYDPGASVETSLGTPGYPVAYTPSKKGWGSISFSEVMYATNENGGLSQWIELYNRTTEIVDLTDWRLVIEARDSKTVQRWTSLRLKSLHIGPNQTVLLVGRKARSSGNIPTDRIYDLYRRNIAAFRRLGTGANRFLGSEGFALRLFSRDGVLVDVAGNLDGRRTPDKPKWELPEGWTETGKRTSLIRAYDNRVPGLGTVSDSFVRAADTALLKGYSYWGLPTDNGTPGYRQGSPLPVTLSSVRASRTDTGVVVNWTTVSEMENAGFYVLRSQHRTTGFVRVTPSLILGAGTTAERHTYTYTDTTAQSNVPYYYRLEEVSLSGERRAVTTVRLRGHLSAAGKSLGKWADVKELP